MISRKAAIDKINERQRKLIYCLGFENDMVKIMDIAKSIITAIPSVQPEIQWIPVERELPEDLAEVNVTWVNPFAKSKPFTASAVYYEGNWYWYSSVCADVLAEYGRNDVDKVDDTIEITAWRPLPEPYQGGDSE